MSRHVLFVHDNRSLGGVGAVSRQLAAGLAERGWSVDHFHMAQRGELPGAMSRLVKKRGVVLATQNFSASYAAAAIGAVCRRPWVMAVHGPVMQVLRAAQAKPAKRRFLRWVYGRAPVIVCSSQASLDSLREFSAPDAAQHVEVIRNTAAEEFKMSAPREQRPAQRIGFVGRLSAEKQPLLLLDVLRALPAAWQLEVVGTGPLAAEFERAGAAEIASGRLRIAGLQAVGSATYHRWDATLLCSAYEGYPLVLLESLASGVPVVSTPIPPAVEMLAQHAPYMLARDATPQSLARAVLELSSRDAGEVQRDIGSINRAHDPRGFIDAWDHVLTHAAGR